ncbi:Uncharacterised protein [uncultured archaeon]|nr:Uncharacterised protein [uncultured archaeon]
MEQFDKTKSNKFVTYPEQSEYVKGTKVWLSLPDDQEIVISPQARKILQMYEVDEKAFIEYLKQMLKLFSNLGSDKTMKCHRISVKKASLTEFNSEDGWCAHIRIDIKDIHGTMKEAK